MAEIQNKIARKLLPIIASAYKSKKTLTYTEAAEQLGRVPPQNHARATAQVCDFLDAAACLAGIPLLALIVVLENSRNINQKAFKKEYGSRRNAIISRSRDHRFQDRDFVAISNAIDDLGKRGNVTSWGYVNSLYPGDLLYRRLIGDYSDTRSNAVDDLGTDTPDRAKSNGWSYDRDPKVRNAVFRRAQGTCEFCGKIGFMKSDGTRYLESHHIIALAADGADRLTNVIALCPNDHREAHFGERGKEIELEMMLKLKAILTPS